MPSNQTQSKPTNPMRSLRRHIAALASLPEADEPVISCYLDLRTPIESLRSSFAMWATAARHSLPKETRPSFDAAKTDIVQAMKQTWPDEVRSVAIFARPGTPELLMVQPFSATLETHFDVSPKPAIFPLVQLKDRFNRFVVVVCTEETGRIVEVTLGAVSEEIMTSRPDLHARLGRQLSREHFHHRREEDTRRFIKDQVEIIANLMARRGLNHLILAGHPRHVSALKDHLPKHILSQVVGSVLHAPNGHDYSPVIEEAIDTFIQAEQDESHSTVQRLHAQIRRNGLAVVGIEASRQAIEVGAASELVISEELPHADREELVRLAATHDISIEVCEGDDLLQSHGGVGCLLRFRLEYLGLENQVE